MHTHKHNLTKDNCTKQLLKNIFFYNSYIFLFFLFNIFKGKRKSEIFTYLLLLYENNLKSEEGITLLRDLK